MENYKLVMPEHLNHHGFLFGGDLLKWVDEYAWIAASLEFPGCNLVTVAMDRVEFRRSVREGTILRFDVRRAGRGRTSAQYSVTVHRGSGDQTDARPVFSTHVTLVRVDADGRKQALPPEGAGEPEP